MEFDYDMVTVLKEQWYGGQDVDLQTKVGLGQKYVNLFNPPSVNCRGDDLAMIATIGIAMLYAISSNTEPTEQTFQAVAHCLMSCYGIGMRRGSGAVTKRLQRLKPYDIRVIQLQQEEIRQENEKMREEEKSRPLVIVPEEEYAAQVR